MILDVEPGTPFETIYTHRRGVVIRHAPHGCGTVVRFDALNQTIQISSATEVIPLAP